MGTGAGFLRHFAETVTKAIAESDAKLAALDAQMAEERTENERLRRLALADGIHYGGAEVIRLLDTVGEDEEQDKAA
jgi:hypothetical protein